MSGTLFALPGLSWRPDDRRELTTPEGAQAPALGDWSGPRSLPLALMALDPLMRALELAGYVTTAIHLGASGGGTAPATWVEIDPALMHVAEVPVAVEWPAGARFVTCLQVDPRRTATNRSLAIAGAPLGPMPFEPFWSTEGSSQLLFHTQQAVSTGGDLLDALDASGIPAWVEQAVVGLGNRWNDSGFYGELDPAGAGAAPGLLWIFDPRFWDTEIPTWTTPDAVHALDAARRILGVANADATGFIRAQVLAGTRSDLKLATVVGLLEVAMGDGSVARSFKRDYFAAMENRFLWAIEHANPDVEPEFPLDVATFHDVCGQGWIGYPSRLRYLDVILYLAESRVLPFPALLHAELLYAFQFEEDPVEVVMSPDHLGVEIRILGSEPIVLRREPEFDIGFPVEQCFSWEYMGADARGIATLVVVAAPGVSVSGREHVVPSWRLVVHRIQNHDLVPPWGDHIQTASLMAPEDEGSLYACDLMLYEDGDATEGIEWEIPPRPANMPSPAPAFRLRPLPLGMRITYPAAEGDAKNELAVDIMVGEGAAGDRFSYWIEPTPPVEIREGDPVDLGLRQRYRLIVCATPAVQITVYHNFISPVEEVYQRATAISGIDPPGVPMSADPAEMVLRGVTNVEDADEFLRQMLWFDYEWLFFFAQMGADVGIGMIPVVGDAVDIFEFLGSFLTGTDKWGHPVTSVDQAIMFGAILLPGISSGALRGLKAIGG